MVLLPEVPVRAVLDPLGVPEAAQDALAVPMHTNLLVATPEPPAHTMKTMTVVVLLPGGPARADLDRV